MNVRLLVVEVLDEAGEFRPLDAIERDVIRLALAIVKNRREVARRLGIGPSTLYRKMALYRAAPAPLPPLGDNGDSPPPGWTGSGDSG